MVLLKSSSPWNKTENISCPDPTQKPGKLPRGGLAGGSPEDDSGREPLVGYKDRLNQTMVPSY